VHEANGRIFLDERELWPNGQFVTAQFVVNTKFLNEHPELVKTWLRAHVELTDWINGHRTEAKSILNAQIQKETGKALPSDVLDDAFGRLEVTYDPLRTAFLKAAQSAFDAGFLGRQMPDLSNMYDLKLLNQVLTEKGRKQIQ
jgi:NitT/TauT family transport system substrate-binding protein